MARGAEREALEIAPARAVSVEYMTGRALYERVIQGMIARARLSVWISTANLKEVLVEAPRGTAAFARGEYVPSLELFDGLCAKGVELRILHASVPSRAFARQLVRRRHMLRPTPGRRDAPLRLRRCPRVHFKAIVVDGAQVYLGSANWTGAGLGAKGNGRRNFEVGFVSDDELLLDDVQGLFDRVWSGRECRRCALRDLCPAPIDGLDAERAAP